MSKGITKAAVDFIKDRTHVSYLALQEAVKGAAFATEEETQRARKEWAIDDLGIDDDAQVIRNEHGTWVNAWVYIRKE